MISRPIRVVLADDHTLVRATLSAWLRSPGGMEVVAEVGGADDAFDACLKFHPEVVVLDIDMPGLQAFDAARKIRSRCPNTRVLFLSGFMNDRYIESALAAGAQAYITKGEQPQAVADAIRQVMQGKTYFSPEIRSRLIFEGTEVKLDPSNATKASLLTLREVEVLRYIARGMAKKEIATTMHLSVKTIDNHCTSMMNKLDIHDRVELARFAIREGLSEP